MRTTSARGGHVLRQAVPAQQGGTAGGGRGAAGSAFCSISITSGLDPGPFLAELDGCRQGQGCTALARPSAGAALVAGSAPKLLDPGTCR